jgi:DNA-directed RNA polymerase specialized sigma24 family protein
LRHEAGLTLREIARRFGVGYSAVGHRISAVKARLRADRQLRVQLEKCKVKT